MNFTNIDFEKKTNEYLGRCNVCVVKAVKFLEFLANDGIQEPDQVDFVFDQHPFATMTWMDQNKLLCFCVSETDIFINYEGFRKNTKHKLFSNLLDHRQLFIDQKASN